MQKESTIKKQISVKAAAADADQLNEVLKAGDEKFVVTLDGTNYKVNFTDISISE